jgi:hypothetical protein
MKAASLNEIKKQLDTLDALAMEKICLRLARYKKENKELLTYLLFEAHDEEAYASNVKIDVDELFETLPRGNVYFIKKSVRKIIRFINKQVRFSGASRTEIEVRIYFCLKMRSASVPLNPGTVLYNLYHQQLKMVQAVWSKLPEDLRFDYERDLELIREPTG